MDLGQLRYFLKIAEHGSFTKAAYDCSVSQPALSQQISKLEKELRQPLFERRGRSIRLTPAGQVLHLRADKILQMVDDAKKQITDDGQTGRISLSAIPTVAPYLLPVILNRAGSLFPKADFVISEDSSGDLLKRCSNGDVDVGILALPATAKHLTIEPLFDEELMLALSPDNPLSQKPEPTFPDLRDERLILLRDTHCLVDSIESFCNPQHRRALTTSRIEQLTTLQLLISLNQGISLVPKMASAITLNGRITYRSMGPNRPQRTIALCFNPCRYQSKLLGNFVKAVRELCSQGFPFQQEISNRIDHLAPTPPRPNQRRSNTIPPMQN